MKKLREFNKYALGINIAIILLEIYAAILRMIYSNRTWFDYYTVDSNFLAMFAAMAYVYYALRGKELPHWAEIMKLSTVVALVITFLVCIFVLAPVYPGGFAAIMFGEHMLFMHTVCPILLFVSFVFFEHNKLSNKDIPAAMIYTLVYAAIMLTLNILRVEEGPYPFLMVYRQPIWASILWSIGILGGATALTWGTIKLRRHK